MVDHFHHCHLISRHSFEWQSENIADTILDGDEALAQKGRFKTKHIQWQESENLTQIGENLTEKEAKEKIHCRIEKMSSFASDTAGSKD